MNPSGKSTLRGTKDKVIAAFLVSCLSIAAALGIAYYSFSDLLITVDNLSKPNDKLTLLNNLFQQITQLDHLQRAEVIRNPGKKYQALLGESKPLIFTLDSLRSLTWEEDEQMQKLDEMESLLRKRDQLLFSYFRLKSEFVLNKNFTEQLDSLATIISWSYSHSDTSVSTTERRTVTTTYPVQSSTESNRSFWDRTFGRNKSGDTEETHIEVQEEWRVKVDTIYLAQQDSVIAAIGRLMKNIEADRRVQGEQMIQRELQLINANTNIIGRLLSTLREVEKEELAREQIGNDRAAELVSESIIRIGLIMIVFFLIAAMLVFRIIRDITRSNALRKQLIEAKERAEELGQIKQRFLANMSHEIRTPLQSIIGFAEQLKPQDESEKVTVNAIHSSSEHLLHIVNEVLDFSKIESGKMIIGREVFQLPDIIHEVVAAMQVQATKKNLDFQVETESVKDIPLIGDPFRLRQILYNLLGNAVKFTLKGSVKLVVMMEDDDYMVKCRFKIIDTGLGMTQKEITNVFQQFEQAHAGIDRQFGGTGLGLTIVKKLVEAQNGNLMVESDPGLGSAFTVELRFNKAPSQAKKTPQQSSEVTEKNFAGKVLVVDDDPMILRLCGVILEKYGISYQTYSEPVKVLEQPIDININFILLDIWLPGINGLELCQELRKKTHAGTKIVALTAHALPQEQSDLLNNGFDHVLTKPFKEVELLEQLGITPVLVVNEEKTNDIPDLHILRKMTMGDEALFQSVLQQFLEESKQDVMLLEERAKHLEGDKVRELVHKLAGRIGQVGSERTAQKLRTIEDDLVEGKTMKELADRLYSAIHDVHKLLNRIQEQKKGIKV